MVDREAPMVRLLRSQARRRGFHRLKVWAGLSVALFVVPALLWGSASAGDGLALRSFAFTFAFAMAVLVPVGQMSGDAALLTSLRRGRCLEEVVGTLTPSREVVDQIAAFSVLSVLRVGASVALPILAGLLVACPQVTWGQVAVGWLLWFPAAAALVLLGSYAMQAAAIWTPKGRAGASMGVLALLVPALGLLVEDPLATAGVAGMLAVGLGIGCRALAIRGLDRACLPAPTVARRLLGLRGLNVLRNNPIAMRESRRLGARLPLPRHWLLALTLVGLVLWRATGEPGSGEAALALYGFFFFLQPLLASLQTSKAVQIEREGSTLETLATSGLEARVFVDGWAGAAWGPRLLESVTVVGAAALLYGSPADGLPLPLAGLALLPDLVIRLLLGSYLGLAVAGWAKSGRDTGALLFCTWLGLGIALTSLNGMAMAVVATICMEALPDAGALFGLLAVVLSSALTGLAALGLRALALRRIAFLLGPQR